MPVSHRTAHLETLALARAHRPPLVLGFGVAVSREQVTVERRAQRRVADKLDAWGEVRALPRGPRSLPVSIDPARLATALAAGLSDDAGDYVCNGWLYRMLRGDPSGLCGFVHVPPTGLEPDRLLKGLERYLEDG
jgi:pyrrolidone-carboxylate peptidase